MHHSSSRTIMAATLLGIFSVPALATDDAPAAVTFSGTADMPSMRDPAQHDKFNLTISDAQVITTFGIECKAGTSALGGLVKANEECAVTGKGMIINPQNPAQQFPRTQYSGGFVVKPTGETDMGKITVSYLPVGKVPASSASLTGVIHLKPENPSPTAGLLKAAILKHLQAQVVDSTALVDNRVDTVELPDLFIPSAGFTSDKGCTWRGSMAFAYQTDSWFMDLTATCEGKEYVLKGNMPWVDSPGATDRTQYNLTLTLPSPEATGDDAMFASPTGDGDMFAVANGISGTIVMDESQYVDTMVDGKMEHLPSRSKISGTITGQAVPLDTVRSLANLIAILARTFFGA
jgi:hypothetical protein